ncbi:MAG: glutamine--fructose-6-phosphate transaminase (isomerizing) [Chloroflexota bacterium]|nr:glutamine--fructose-6-phosphate transaminase (isomerizing) [Chloroflexota bacterium]
MCGIFAYAGGETAAADMILDGLRRLEYRGYDSWGVAVRSNGGILIERQVGKIGDARVSMPASTAGFGHTRWATHGGVTEANAHPHADCTGRLALIHNGIVENHSELRQELLASGHVIRSETDSEVIVHLIEQSLRSRNGARDALADATREVFARLEGMNAIMVLDSHTDTLVAVKNGSPLVAGYGRGRNYVASDASALLPHTRRVTFLSDGEMAVISPDKIEVRDASSGNTLSPEVSELDWSLDQSELGDYPHYLIKEIHEQPTIVRSIALMQVDTAQRLADMVRRSFGTFFIGCGTAANAALTGQYLFSRIARFHVNFEVGSEFGYLEHFLTPESLVIALSQSGETIDVIEPLTRAKREKGLTVAALVNVLGSTLYRMADFHFLLNAGPEKCVLATKSYTAKLAVLTLTAFAMDNRVDEGRELLLRAADLIEEQLSDAAKARAAELADRIAHRDDMFIIGRGLSYASSLEAALKIKEVSYIHAEGFPGGELKHGVIALVEEGTPCIVFAPNDETHGAILSGAMELRARGAYIIGVSPWPSEAFDYYIPVGDAGDASPIVNAVPAQLLAYNLALKRGTDPDKPRNLAKSVTVK